MKAGAIKDFHCRGLFRAALTVIKELFNISSV